MTLPAVEYIVPGTYLSLDVATAMKYCGDGMTETMDAAVPIPEIQSVAEPCLHTHHCVPSSVDQTTKPRTEITDKQLKDNDD